MDESVRIEVARTDATGPFPGLGGLGYQPGPNSSVAYPKAAGRGVLRRGDRVRFARWPKECFARRNLVPGTVYTVRSCDFDGERLRLRLAEHPGLAFRRTMFDQVS